MHAKDNLYGWPNRSIVVGVFTDRATADRAVTDLRKAGFRNDQIGVVTRHDLQKGTAKVEEGSHWEEGAAVGALAGLGAGGLVGLGVLAGVIPVIGPVIAGGTLAVIMANAAGGAVIGGIVGALAGLGIPEEEARFYENEVKAGRSVVTIKAENRIAEAVDILQRHGATHYQQDSAQCATACATTEQTTGMSQGKTMRSSGSEKVQVREEVLTPRKDVTSGEVRVRKEVVTEHKTIDVPVQREEVIIERRPMSGAASSTPIRPGEEIRIPVKEEHVRVEKHPVVKEEIEVSKRVVQETEHVSGTVKKEQVRIEEKGGTNVSRTSSKKK